MGKVRKAMDIKDSTACEKPRRKEAAERGSAGQESRPESESHRAATIVFAVLLTLTDATVKAVLREEKGEAAGWALREWWVATKGGYGVTGD